MKYEFIKAGSNAVYEPKKLYLDVGNVLCIGIVDHHHLDRVQKSATCLVFESPSFIGLDTTTIVLHENPDLDCIASSYLASYFIEHKEFPKCSHKLCTFLNNSDFGIKSQHTISLSSLFSIITAGVKSSEKIVRMGHQLIEKMAEYGFDSAKYPKSLQEYVTIINEDNKVFAKDIQNLDERLFCIKNRTGIKKVQVKGLVLKNPKSKLFKSWAREFGYDLLIVIWSESRVVISLKGDSFFSLIGIGECLNKKESESRDKLGIIIDEKNRVGYDIADPWYDGRAHNFTIVDTPRRGTTLNFDEILRCLS